MSPLRISLLLDSCCCRIILVADLDSLQIPLVVCETVKVRSILQKRSQYQPQQVYHQYRMCRCLKDKEVRNKVIMSA